jgi:hypothetical protein
MAGDRFANSAQLAIDLFWNEAVALAILPNQDLAAGSGEPIVEAFRAKRSS